MRLTRLQKIIISVACFLAIPAAPEVGAGLGESLRAYLTLGFITAGILVLTVPEPKKPEPKKIDQ